MPGRAAGASGGGGGGGASTAATTTITTATTTQRNLRACMCCSVVQPQAKFLREGCPNCEDFLQLANSHDAIEDCTSQVFEGMLTLVSPARSWAAKFHRLSGYRPGQYAIKVVGTLPDVYIRDMESRGIPYHPRDGSATIAD